MTTSNWFPVALLTSGKLQDVAGKTGNEQSLSNNQIPSSLDPSHLCTKNAV